MTSASQPVEKRHPWRWFWGFLFLFLAHVGLVFWLNQRSPQPPPPEQIQPLIYLGSDDAVARHLSRITGDSDPALFALPSERGFSGPAWLTFRSSDIYISNWSAAPSWLALDTNDLGTEIISAAATNHLGPNRLLANLHAVAPFELRIPADTLSVTSSFRIEGPVAQRELVFAPSLPFATNLDVLTNSVVDIVVNGAGVVESEMLVNECGQRAADETALRVARQMVFTPLKQPRVARERAIPTPGRLIFTWHVVPPPFTNGLTSTAP